MRLSVAMRSWFWIPSIRPIRSASCSSQVSSTSSCSRAVRTSHRRSAPSTASQKNLLICYVPLWSCNRSSPHSDHGTCTQRYNWPVLYRPDTLNFLWWKMPRKIPEAPARPCLFRTPHSKEPCFPSARALNLMGHTFQISCIPFHKPRGGRDTFSLPPSRKFVLYRLRFRRTTLR